MAISFKNIFRAILQCTAILHSTKLYYEMQIGFVQKTTQSLDKNTICAGNETVNRISSGQLAVGTPVRNFRHGITSPYQGFKVSLLCLSPLPLPCIAKTRYKMSKYIHRFQKTIYFGNYNIVNFQLIQYCDPILFTLLA